MIKLLKKFGLLGTSLFSTCLLSACLLSGCGFQLQGKQQLPSDFNQVYVSSNDIHSKIIGEIILLFTTNKIELASTTSQAQIVFHIISDSQTDKQVGSNTIQETRMYRMTYQMTFALETPTGETVYGPRTLSSSVVHYVYSGQVLGNNQEEAPIYASLRKDTLQKLLLKLSSSDIKHALQQIQPTQVSNETD